MAIYIYSIQIFDDAQYFRLMTDVKILGIPGNFARDLARGRTPGHHGRKTEKIQISCGFQRRSLGGRKWLLTWRKQDIFMKV
jgi:hypothetical protein